jgi:transposase InsO family protein
VVDDMSRVAYVAHVPDESGTSAARALLDAAVFFAERGVRIERVLTDNGKAERFIKTLLAEWAYGKLYRSNAERITALPRWVAFYNHRRSHTALDGQPPMTALVNNVRGNHN